VPRGPFFASGDASFVYVLSEDGRQATRRTVRFGAIEGSMIEVLEGLAPGERIIYSSYSAFRAYPTIQLLPEGGREIAWP
jgi:HlyD family secretion protein